MTKVLALSLPWFFSCFWCTMVVYCLTVAYFLTANKFIFRFSHCFFQFYSFFLNASYVSDFLASHNEDQILSPSLLSNLLLLWESSTAAWGRLLRRMLLLRCTAGLHTSTCVVVCNVISFLLPSTEGLTFAKTKNFKEQIRSLRDS